MDTARIARRGPFGIEVEAGQTYWWCSCGRSSKQTFCDGSHKGTTFTPLRFQAEQSGTLWFCGCKRTAGAPLCDGSHHRLPSDSTAGA